MKKDLLIWQLADSAFPSGGFAHSGGLEAVHQLGIVCDAPSLEAFIENALRQVQRGVARFAAQAWEHPDQFAAIDQDCDLFLNNHVANRASRAQGQALLSSGAKAFDGILQGDVVPRCLTMARRERLPTHLASVFGLFCGVMEIPRSQAGNLFLFIHLRGYISSAVRLGIVGPIQGQKIQAKAGSNLPETRPEADDVPAQINPLLDLVQLMQDRLYSRLFQS